MSIVDSVANEHGKARPCRGCAAALAVWALAACMDPTQPGALVPPTADEDPRLPRAQLTFAGRPWWLHVQTFGDPEAPAVFVIPGGPGADFRLLLPLRALAQEHFVVMYDAHGAGLSQRTSERTELSLDSFDAELEALHARFAPQRPVALIGHSFGGVVAVRYAARHPESVRQLVLVEPGPLNARAQEHRPSSWVSASVLESVFWQNEVLTSADHAQADFNLLGELRRGTDGYYCDGQKPHAYPIWRFGAYALEVVPQTERGDFDHRAGIERFAGSTLVVAGSCGELGAAFQREYQLPLLPNAQLVSVEAAGHISLFIDHASQTVAAITDFLREQAP